LAQNITSKYRFELPRCQVSKSLKIKVLQKTKKNKEEKRGQATFLKKGGIKKGKKGGRQLFVKKVEKKGAGNFFLNK
jgi:hypothetical protein